MNRRDMLALSIAGGAGMAAVVRPASARARRSGADDSPEHQAAVAGGVAYFSKQCDVQAGLCRQLEAAIRSGDLAAAREELSRLIPGDPIQLSVVRNGSIVLIDLGLIPSIAEPIRKR